MIISGHNVVPGSMFNDSVMFGIQPQNIERSAPASTSSEISTSTMYSAKKIGS